MIRLIQGDCIEVMQELSSENIKVDLILIDPPYENTTNHWDKYIPIKEMWACIKEIRNDTTPIVIFGSEPFSSHLRLSNLKEYRYDWIWKKSNSGSIGIAKWQPMRYHELISVFYKKWGQYYKQMIPRESPRIRQGIRTGWGLDPIPPKGLMEGNQNIHVDASKYSPDVKNPSSVLEFNSIKGNSKEKVAHPTQKPVALLEYLVKTYTNEGDLVLDFCMGSGSTGVASRNCNRDFIGVELDEDYFKLAKDRLSVSQSRLI